jgi:renalase
MRRCHLKRHGRGRRVKVGIVGSGVAGLAAARLLSQAGHDVVVWERSDHVGGRVETVAIEGYVFDPGATSIAPRGMAIEHVMLHELDTSHLLRVEEPIYTHEALRVIPGDPSRNAARYTYDEGNACLPKLLAEGLDVQLNRQVEEITRSGQSFVVFDEACDALILTAPIPQTSVLLWTLHESRPVANAKYRSCIAVMLGFAQPAPDVHYHALLDVEQRHPLTWLSLESVKSPKRAPEGCCAMLAQMGPSYSLMQYNKADQEIIDDVLIYLQRLYGAGFQQPIVAQVRRWKYSQPEMVAQFETVNPPSARLILAGDGLMAGRVESAFESGVKAARLLIDR